MKAWIIKHFPKTEDAILVDKHFGSAFEGTASGRAHGIALEGKEKEMLAEAQRLEKEKKGE